MEQTGESVAAADQRTLPTPFLTKTYQLVDDPAVDDMISWNEDGSGFIIWKPAEFARDLLPKYFKHNNLSSFVRQLNTYGFRKVVPDRWEFANDCFKKGEKGLLKDIQRRKLSQVAASPSPVAAAAATTATLAAAPTTPAAALFNHLTTPVAAGTTTPANHFGMQLMQVSPANSGDEQGLSSTSSPAVKALLKMTHTTNSTTPELVEENERLKKENLQMNNELSHLRGLCNNIFMMMSGYGPPGQQDPGGPSMESRQLDLMPSGRMTEDQGGSSGGGAGAMDYKQAEEEEDGMSPKLFGVSIGAKRMKRSGDSESPEWERQELQIEYNSTGNKAQSEMKLDPAGQPEDPP